jgi:hypothetical protein
MHLDLHVKIQIFLSSVTRIWITATHIHESLRYLISRKSVQRKPSSYMRTHARQDRQDEGGDGGLPHLSSLLNVYEILEARKNGRFCATQAYTRR